MLTFNLVLLPLMFGGRYEGWFAAAQVLTFAVLSLLALSGRLSFSAPKWQGFLILSLSGLAVAATASAVFSGEPGASYPALFEWLWLAACALLALFLSEGRRARELLGVLLLVGVFVQAFWSFFVWWGGGDPTRQQAGTFYAPNQYAGYLVLLAPLFLAICLTSRRRLTAIGAGFVAAYVYLGVALSGSRGGVLAALLGIGAMIVMTRRWGHLGRTLLRSAAFLAAFFLLGVLMTSPVIFHSSKAATGVQGVVGVKGADAATTLQRIHWDVGALQIGIERPLVGAGLGTFGDMFYKVQKPQWQWSRWAHDQYLEAFAEGGFPLLAGMTALPLIAILGACPALRRLLSGEDFWRLGLWAGLVGASAHLLVDHDWSYPAYAVTYVIVATSVLAPWDDASPGAAATKIRSRTKLGRAWRIGIVAPSILCLLGVTGQLASERLSRAPGNLHLAMVLAPYSPVPFDRRATQLAALGGTVNLKEAAELLRGAVARSQLDPDLRWKLAGIYTKLGDLTAARRAYQAAIDIAPGAVRTYLLAASFEVDAAREPARAVRILDQGLAYFRSAGPSGASALAELIGARTYAGQLGE